MSSPAETFCHADAIRAFNSGDEAAYQAWRSALAAISAVAVAVLDNLLVEEQFCEGGTRSFADFIREILSASASGTDLVHAYQEVCWKNQRCGPAARDVPDVIYHLVNEDDLERMVERTQGGRVAAGSSGRRAWHSLRESIRNPTSMSAAEIDAARAPLRGIGLASNGHQVFAGFDKDLPSSEVPLSRMDDATQACAALGLPQNWSTYAPGQKIWRLAYRLSGVATAPDPMVPTVADAEWSEVFDPQPAGAPCGKARGLLDEHGRAEVVHEQPTPPIDFVGLPFYLGQVVQKTVP